VIAELLGRQSPRVETMLRDVADDLLAFTGFPAALLTESAVQRKEAPS
jgi:putative transposase